MARDKRRLLYLDAEVDQQVQDRAKSRGVSVNEWLNLAILHALSGERAVTVKETHVRETRREV